MTSEETGAHQSKETARTASAGNHAENGVAKVRRYWKEARRKVWSFARSSGLDHALQTVVAPFIRSLIFPGPSSSTQAPAAPQVEDERTDRGKESQQTPTRQRRPLRVRFRSPPNSIIRAPYRGSQFTPTRVEKPGSRTMSQRRKRQELFEKLRNSPLSLATFRRSERRKSEPKPTLANMESAQINRDKKESSQDSGLNRHDSSQQSSGEILPFKAPIDALKKTSLVRRSDTDISAKFQDLGLRDASPPYTALAGKGVPVKRSSTRLSSTRLSSSSKLLSTSSLPQEDTSLGPSTKPKKRHSSLPSLASREDSNNREAKDLKADSGHHTLTISRRRSLTRILARKKAEEEAEAARPAIEAEKAEKERTRRLAEEQARQAQEAMAARINAQKSGLRSVPQETILKPLSTTSEHRVLGALMQHPDFVLTETPIEVKRYDLGTLLPQRGTDDRAHGWLNDAIIQAAMTQAVQYALAHTGFRRGQVPKFHAHNPFFASTLRDRGPAAVKRFGKRANIMGGNLLQVEIVFVPVCHGSHWTLLVAYPMARVVEYYDSMGGDGKRYLQMAVEWLAEELGELFVESEWTTRTEQSPQQNNGRDCGVFTVTTAKMILLGWDPPAAYDCTHIQDQRARIAAELLAGGYEGELEPPVPVGRWAGYVPEKPIVVE